VTQEHKQEGGAQATENCGGMSVHSDLCGGCGGGGGLGVEGDQEPRRRSTSGMGEHRQGKGFAGRGCIGVKSV